jgi:hypothetical protein
LFHPTFNPQTLPRRFFRRGFFARRGTNIRQLNCSQRDEARRIAANIAKLPELSVRRVRFSDAGHIATADRQIV